MAALLSPLAFTEARQDTALLGPNSALTSPKGAEQDPGHGAHTLMLQQVIKVGGCAAGVSPLSPCCRLH